MILQTYNCNLMNRVKIVGIERIDNYDGCLKCSSTLVKNEEDPDFGQCTKCQMLQDSASILSAQNLL